MPRQMHGLGVSSGETAGPVARLSPPAQLPANSVEVTDKDAEVERAAAALEAVATELERRAENVTGAAADVLGAQVMIARDPTLATSITQRIQAGADAPHAAARAFAEQRKVLESLGGYMAERAADLSDLSDRTVTTLLGEPMPGVPDPGHPFVLVALDLSPADTATLDPEKVLAIVTEGGGPTGHTAILAKQLGIPAVISCTQASELKDGDIVLLDGSSGDVIAEPGEAEIEAARARQSELAQRRSASSGPGKTADGHAVPLLANIGGPADLNELTLQTTEGSGLFRTEFLYLDRAVAPTYEEQLAAYEAVFEAYGTRKVVVRTLDVGADKPLLYLDRPAEPNPALGVRGLRLVRGDRELLSEQLRAIAEAAGKHQADVWVMAPMVATPGEAQDFAAMAREQGLSKVGVMVEIPAAALTADEIFAQVDFASIGTNDLTQYAMAADRLAGELAELLDPWQPGVLRLIAMTAKSGAVNDRPVGVCGEAASDPLLALVLVGMGVTTLSMAAVCVADVRSELAEHTLAQCQELAKVALAQGSARAARAAVAELAEVNRKGSTVPAGAL